MNPATFAFIAVEANSGDPANVLVAEGPGTQDQAVKAALAYGTKTLNRTFDQDDEEMLRDEGYYDLGTHRLYVLDLTPFKS